MNLFLFNKNTQRTHLDNDIFRRFFFVVLVRFSLLLAVWINVTSSRDVLPFGSKTRIKNNNISSNMRDKFEFLERARCGEREHTARECSVIMYEKFTGMPQSHAHTHTGEERERESDQYNSNVPFFFYLLIAYDAMRITPKSLKDRRWLFACLLVVVFVRWKAICCCSPRTKFRFSLCLCARVFVLRRL